mmetsp:Transcript_8830/g.29529  ORF Transcript_8830/g.29529 Transcript_8830/m.29529 type:complete len:81 (+) Transcript_8830:2191-2433(+)
MASITSDCKMTPFVTTDMKRLRTLHSIRLPVYMLALMKHYHRLFCTIDADDRWTWMCIQVRKGRWHQGRHIFDGSDNQPF